MSGFDDLHEFARDHRTCGRLLRTDSEPHNGRVQLTLTCGCGATRSRWVALAEIRDLPGVTAPPPRSSGAGPAAGAAPAEGTAPRRRRRGGASAGPPERPALDVDRTTLEDVMRRALREVEQSGQALDRGDQRRLEDVMQSALRELEAAPGSSPSGRGGDTAGGGPRPRPAGRPRRRAVVRTVAAVVLLVAGLAAAWSAIHWGREDERAIVASTTPASLRPLSEGDRRIVGQTLAVLRELQGLGRPDVPPRVYLNRVSFARTDVERGVAELTDTALRASLRDALAIHVLAASAWRAKTVNEPRQWEAAGEDPAVGLCPAVERLLSVGDEPKAMSRAEWRGIALAAVVPLLWDCAADRLAAIETGVRDR